MFCSKCGKEINDDAVVCIHCGCAVNGNVASNNNSTQSTPIIKERNWLVSVLLCWFLGEFGIHRFYTGYIGIGIAQLLTFGGCGIWSFVDFVCLCFDYYRDAEGNRLAKFNKIAGIVIFVLTLILLLIYFLFNFLVALIL